MADNQTNQSTAQDPNTQTADQAVASTNAYELIKKRLIEQGSRLEAEIARLNDARLSEFGNTQMQVIARTRIRTEHNCIARDMVQVGDYLLFGYNVFMGLKRVTQIGDVLSLYRLIEPASADGEYQLEEVAINGTFLDQSAFVQDFEELYRYYKHTRLLQLTIRDGKLLIAFQIGERVSDIRVFRFGLDFSEGVPESAQVAYIDNRGERDIELPPAYDFEWVETDRDQMVNGKHPHMNILDTLFVETVGGDLTIKIENNTESGLGIYSEPVNDRTQSLTDAEIHYAKVGSLILLKILPYREDNYRYFVYNTLTESVLRLDAIGQSCVQLPEDHGIIFPGGYYLQTGEHKLFGNASNGGGGSQSQSDVDLKFKRKIVAPNGEDMLYLFYDVAQGITGLFAYNLIKKQLANPIYCNGMALADSGRLVLFNAESEPSRIHPMQIWHTPYASDEYVSELPESTSFYGKVGNKELVRGISDLYGVTRLIGNQSVSQKLYEELADNANKLFDRYYWLSEPELEGIADNIKEVTATAELVIDEFAKVQSIQKQTQNALAEAETQQQDILRDISVTTFESASDYVEQLAKLRRQKGRLSGLEDLRYLDTDKLDALKEAVNDAENSLAEQTVIFLSGDNALAGYEATLIEINENLATAETNSELTPVLETIDSTAQDLDLLTELLGTLDVADATVRTQIIDDISAIYAKLNQSKAKLNHKRKNLGSAEAVAQFGAQFRLFSQSIANALSMATTPEQTDEQMAKLLVQLEEMESQFANVDEGGSEQFLNDIIAKREEIFDTFETHKQQLLDARSRKAQSLGDGALRMLESIKKRTQRSAGKSSGLDDEESLNTYFASDSLVQKVRGIVKDLSEMSFSVKADDIEARLKAIQVEAFKSLRDKSDLYEDGGNVIKLGKHRFSINTQPLDLTLISRQQPDGSTALNLHLTGTDYYEVIDNPELNALRPFWDMDIASESPNVYRGEYLAYSIIHSARTNQDGLTEAKLYQAYADTLSMVDNDGEMDVDNNSPLYKLVRAYATPRYQMGYAKGIHDHDATLLLMQILPKLQKADTLIYTPQVRALAQLFYWQIRLILSLNQAGVSLETLGQLGSDASVWLSDTHLVQIANWSDRAVTAEQLKRSLGSDTAKALLTEDISKVMQDFVLHYFQSNNAQTNAIVNDGTNGTPNNPSNADLGAETELTIFTPQNVPLASQYLVEVLGQVSHLNDDLGGLSNFDTTNQTVWQTSQKAQSLVDELTHKLDTATWSQLQTAKTKLTFAPKSAYELLVTWFDALLENGYQEQKTHVLSTVANISETDSELVDGQTDAEGNPLTVEQMAEQEDLLAQVEQKRHLGKHYIPEAIAILLTQLDESQWNYVIQQFKQLGVSADAKNRSSSSRGLAGGLSSSPLSNSQLSSSPLSSSTLSGGASLLGDNSIRDNLAKQSPNSVAQQDTPSNALVDFERRTGEVSLQVDVHHLLGEHDRIHQQTLTFAVDDFMNRLHHHHSVIIPAYQRYLELRADILHKAKDELRLNEFMPRPLSSFVRNRLINESYLPLIGDNLAKQMGTVGDDKRTDLMGILMMISPPGYGKTTLMEYVANRLGLIFMKINCPSLGHDVTSLDPAKAPNATAREELNKINLAFEMGNNVMLYLDDIQHTHAEFLQKFISLGDGTRRIDGVWQGKTKTYDMRGKKFCVVMAGNPYTESGEAFQVPDMLANRADIYNLGDIMSGMEDVFALSYIENALTSNPVLAPLANRDMSDVYRLINMAKSAGSPSWADAEVSSNDLSYPYSTSEINEMVAMLRRMFSIQDVILQVNQTYIASASQDDKYRVEPVFKLQGSYRNMNKMTEKISSVMNETELQNLIDDHYLGESQLLTTGAESNLLKLKEMRGVLTEAEAERWEQIKADFLRNKAMGGDDTDTGNKIVAQLVDVASGFNALDKTLGGQFEAYLAKVEAEQTAKQAERERLFNGVEVGAKAVTSELSNSLVHGIGQSIEGSFEKSVNQLTKLYQHDHKSEGDYLKQNHQLQKELMVSLVQAIENLSERLATAPTAIEGTSSKSLPSTQTDLNPSTTANGLNFEAMSQALNNAIRPVMAILEDKLAQKLMLDASTEQSGRQIVRHLERLNQIMDEFE